MTKPRIALAPGQPKRNHHILRVTIAQGDGNYRNSFSLDEKDCMRPENEIHIWTHRGDGQSEVIAIPRSGWADFVRMCQSQET